MLSVHTASKPSLDAPPCDDSEIQTIKVNARGTWYSMLGGHAEDLGHIHLPFALGMSAVIFWHDLAIMNDTESVLECSCWTTILPSLPGSLNSTCTGPIDHIAAF